MRQTADQCSTWRVRMAERIGLALDPGRFGVQALYLIGSSKNGTAGPASDIDLLVLFEGTAAERDTLLAWLDGWSLCLDEINFAETGYRTGGLLDVHLLTAADVAARNSYAVRIDAPTDRARRLPLKSPEG